MFKRFISILFAVVCLAALVPNASYAMTSEPSSLTVIMEYGGEPLSGINLAVCRVADAKEVLSGIAYTVSPPFERTGSDFTNLTKEKNIALAASLDAYATANGIVRGYRVTDNNGKAFFSGLSAGLYFVAQVDSDNSEYVITPYLVAVPVPHETKDGWGHSVVAYPKTEPVKRESESISVSVYKIWEGTNSHPDSITVQLYQNGQIYGNMVTLNVGNYWRHTWNDLSPNDKWTVDELNVPAGFIKTVSGNVDSGFVITNTKKSQTSNPPNPPGKPGDGPITGDDSNIRLWVTIMIVNAFILLILLILWSKNCKAEKFKHGKS